MNPLPTTEVSIPYPRVAKFVRQITHDVRNGLSALDLHAAYIAELVTDAEVLEEIRKLREMVTGNAAMLRELSQAFQPLSLHPIPWPLETLYSEVEQRIRSRFADEPGIRFLPADFGPGLEISVDLEQVIKAFGRVVENGIFFRGDNVELEVSAFVEGAEWVLQLREPKTDFSPEQPPETWGLVPMISTRPGGYGLGLWLVRQCMQGHQGSLRIALGDGVLCHQLRFPLASVVAG
mgnify:CR=1 FL=1